MLQVIGSSLERVVVDLGGFLNWALKSGNNGADRSSGLKAS